MHILLWKQLNCLSQNIQPKTEEERETLGILASAHFDQVLESPDEKLCNETLDPPDDLNTTECLRLCNEKRYPPDEDLNTECLRLCNETLYPPDILNTTECPRLNILETEPLPCSKSLMWISIIVIVRNYSDLCLNEKSYLSLHTKGYATLCHCLPCTYSGPEGNIC